MVLECHKQEKEERLKCARENRSENKLVVGNEVLQFGKNILEKLCLK